MVNVDSVRPLSFYTVLLTESLFSSLAKKNTKNPKKQLKKSQSAKPSNVHVNGTNDKVSSGMERQKIG